MNEMQNGCHGNLVAHSSSDDESDEELLFADELDEPDFSAADSTLTVVVA